MKKTALILIIVTFLAKFIGLLREVTLAYFYGASSISDAYLIAMTIPTVLFSFIGTGIVTGFIPIYQERKINYGSSDAMSFTNNLMNIVLVVVTFIVIIGYVFVNQIVFAFASGFDNKTFEMAVSFTKVGLFSTYFIAIVFVLSGFLQANQSYNVTSLIGLPLNFIIIITIVMSTSFSLHWLSYGIVISALFQMLFLLFFSKKNNYKHSFLFNIHDERIKRVVKLSFPVIIGVVFYQLNILVDRTLASNLAMGGISALNYSNKIVDFVQGIFVVSVTTISYPVLSKHIVNNDFLQVKHILQESVGIILLLVIPTTIGSLFFSQEIITLLYGRGAIDENGLKLISSVFFMYSIGMIAFGLKEGISKVFYAMQDSKTPMRNAIIGYACNIVLSVILSRTIGIAGIALATSISMFIISVLLFRSLHKKIGSFGITHMLKSLLKIAVASLIMGIVSKVFYLVTANNIGENVSLIISILLAILIYFSIVYLLKIEDVNIIVSQSIGKIKKIAKN